MKQIYNPFLPLDEYIPDGEPHVFGDRVYIFGSHDKEGGYTFCMRDYVVYSAPVDDLKSWRYEGISYEAKQDPRYKDLKYMYAPDVVRGNDGRYYLYYGLGGDYGNGGYTGPISVAVSDRPEGKYEYLGVVRNQDGSPMMKYICFDPAVINDNGVIRLYYGTWYGYEQEEDFESNKKYIQSEMEMFGRTEEEIRAYIDRGESIMGPAMLTLCDDMLTVKEEAKLIIPYKVKGTSFEAHPFFEGSSIRKVDDKYYFVYSSWQNHELCYAVSDYPDKDFVFGGTIVSNGDVGYKGRTEEDRLNMTGTTHGGIEKINGEWYVFFHRLTHKSDYSRQALAEKIVIEADGSIKQVELTSCGLNGGPLVSSGVYPAATCCNLTQGQMPHGSNTIYGIEFPHITHFNNERFIAEIENETLIGYKYFNFENVNEIRVKMRIDAPFNKTAYDGPLRQDERCFDEERRIKDFISKRKKFNGEKAYLEIRTKIDGEEKGRIEIDKDSSDWKTYSANVKIENGISALYFIYHGNTKLQMLEFELCNA